VAAKAVLAGMDPVPLLTAAEQRAAVSLAPPARTADELGAKRAVAIECVRSFLSYGGTTHRAEALGAGIGTALDMILRISALPGMFLVSINAELGDAAQSETYCISYESDLDASRLAEVDEISVALASKAITTHAALEALRKVHNPNLTLYNAPTRVALSAVGSACSSLVFFGGSWVDAAFSLGAGAIVGVYLFVLGVRFPRLNRLAEFMCSAIVGFLARAIGGSSLGANFCPFASSLASVVWLLPGLTITTAITEVASGSIVSGTSRFFKGALLAFQIGFGLAIGDGAASFAPRATIDEAGGEQCEFSTPAGLAPLWIVVVICAFALLLNAHWRQLWSIGFTALVGWLVLFLLTDTPGSSLSGDAATVISSFSIGLTGSLIARSFVHQSLVLVTVAVLILVPGSLGVRGATSMFSGDGISGINFGASMVQSAFSISIGLIIAKSVLPSHVGFISRAAVDKFLFEKYTLSLI
jgi:uncharacterized membrane protein YjjP (DUF1212 family)